MYFILSGYAVNIVEKSSVKNHQLSPQSFDLLLLLTVFGKYGNDLIVVFKTRSGNELFVEYISLFCTIESHFDCIPILRNHRAGSIGLCRNLINLLYLFNQLLPIVFVRKQLVRKLLIKRYPVKLIFSLLLSPLDE